MVNYQTMARKKQPGLSLIELIIVVGVLVFLALLFSFSLNASQEQVKDAKRISDVNSIQTAVEFYFNGNGVYPNPTPEEGNAWGNLDELLAEYLPDGQLPLPPTASEQYVYLFSGEDPAHFVVGAVLEQAGNKNLLRDSDDSFPTTDWVASAGVTSTGAGVSSISCADPIFCVTE